MIVNPSSYYPLDISSGFALLCRIEMLFMGKNIEFFKLLLWLLKLLFMLLFMLLFLILLFPLFRLFRLFPLLVFNDSIDRLRFVLLWEDSYSSGIMFWYAS
jgi:hypothetical protein